jgi:hypothetical protein
MLDSIGEITPPVGMRHPAFLHDSCFQPGADQAQNLNVSHPPFHQTKKQVVRNRIEVGLQVNIHHERIAIVDALHDRAQRHSRSPLRAESE